jgi:phage-related protein
MLYNSQSDRTAALTLLRNAASTSVDATSPNVGDGNDNSHSEPASKIAHSMATRFKIEQKFTGKLGEDLTEYISNYMDAANDYNLTNQQKMDFMHHLLDGEAKRFYREKFYPLVQTSLKLLQ